MGRRALRRIGDEDGVARDGEALGEEGARAGDVLVREMVDGGSSSIPFYPMVPSAPVDQVLRWAAQDVRTVWNRARW